MKASTCRKRLLVICLVFGGVYLMATIIFINHSATVYSSKIKHLRRPDNPSRQTEVVYVLVLTYMRSGSSLMGDILQQSPQSFYVYEPLRTIHNNQSSSSSSFKIKYVNGSIRRKPYDVNEESVNCIRNWFTCQIDKLSTIGITDSFMQMGKLTDHFLQCHESESARTNTSEVATSCLRLLESSCHSSRIRIIKTIRMDLVTIRGLLDELPQLKIIHLVRDPRPTLQSQVYTGQCLFMDEGIDACTQRHCARVERDTTEKDALIKKYPDRILPILYEDVAKHPLEMSKQIYDFVGAQFTEQAQKYIYSITSAGLPNNCLICTRRSNSSKHVDAWKRSMPKQFINLVQKRCKYVLNRYGYDYFQIN